MPAQLKVVASCDAPKAAARSPEAELRRLFAEEQRLERELTKVRNALHMQRRRFAREEHLLVPPRTELLRTRFGPPPKPCRGDD